MSSDVCGCCTWNQCRLPLDDGRSNWLCQECVDRCPPDRCLVRPDVETSR